MTTEQMKRLEYRVDRGDPISFMVKTHGGDTIRAYKVTMIQAAIAFGTCIADGVPHVLDLKELEMSDFCQIQPVD